MVMPIFTSETIKHSIWSVVVNKKGRVLIAKRSKRSNNPNLWNFPGGGLEPSEGELACAYRELSEELGIQKVDIDLEHRFNLRTRDRHMTVFVFSCNKVVKPKPAKNEVQDAKWITTDDLARESRSPKKWHFQSFMILHNPDVFTAIQILALKMVNPTQ